MPILHHLAPEQLGSLLNAAGATVSLLLSHHWAGPFQFWLNHFGKTSFIGQENRVSVWVGGGARSDVVVMYLVTLGQDCSTVSPSHVPNYWASSALTFHLLALPPPQVTGQLNVSLLLALCLLPCLRCPGSATHNWAPNRCFGCSLVWQTFIGHLLNAGPWDLKLSPLELVLRKPATTSET